MSEKNAAPIGIFDSGVGGLSIAIDIYELLPQEHLIYVADQAYSPYGNKSKQAIEERCLAIAQFFIAQHCKAIVVACNTATVNAIELLRANFDIPIIGVEPGIKPAALNSQSGIVGVLATEQTINSDPFKALVNRFVDHVDVRVQASPKLVDLVENNDLVSEYAQQVVNEYVAPLINQGVDQIALGCTHYVFLAPLIKKAAANKASIINTAAPVAAQLQRRLLEKELLNSSDEKAEVELFTTLASKQNKLLIQDLWNPSDRKSDIAVNQLDI